MQTFKEVPFLVQHLVLIKLMLAPYRIYTFLQRLAVTRRSLTDLLVCATGTYATDFTATTHFSQQPLVDRMLLTGF